MSGLGTAGASAPPKHPTVELEGFRSPDSGAALVECGPILLELADTVQYSLLLAIQVWVKEVDDL
jgi:hypothetical protein